MHEYCLNNRPSYQPASRYNSSTDQIWIPISLSLSRIEVVRESNQSSLLQDMRALSISRSTDIGTEHSILSQILEHTIEHTIADNQRTANVLEQ